VCQTTDRANVLVVTHHNENIKKCHHEILFGSVTTVPIITAAEKQNDTLTQTIEYRNMNCRQTKKVAPMSRKTVEVGKILAMVNVALACPDSTPDGREALCTMLETVLMDAGSYQGYSYIDTDEVEGNGTRRKYFAHKTNVDDYQECIK
jgi:hypothetical protein